MLKNTSPTLPHSTRQESLSHFLQSHGYPAHEDTIAFLAGDASLRRYYRIPHPLHPDRHVVIMDAPAPEDTQPFCDVARVLQNYDLSSPKIFAQDREVGFLILEDFGDTTYTQILTPHNTQDLYVLAVDTLHHIQDHIVEKPECIPDYTLDTLLKEVRLLCDWYIPHLCAIPLTPTAHAAYEALWRDILTPCLSGPKTLVLRDFHVDNLVYLANRSGIQRCGLLDFQDACWGPVVYDYISLIEDARRDVDPALVAHLDTRFYGRYPPSQQAYLKEHATILSAGRHAKILGIFARLAIRDHKPHYLTHIPRVIGLLQRNLAHPKLQKIAQWLQDYCPHWHQVTP